MSLTSIFLSFQSSSKTSLTTSQPFPGIRPQAKLMDYAKVRADVAEFCRYYERWLGTPLTERLKHEINEILEQALDWWGKQEIYDVMEE